MKYIIFYCILHLILMSLSSINAQQTLTQLLLFLIHGYLCKRMKKNINQRYYSQFRFKKVDLALKKNPEIQ